MSASPHQPTLPGFEPEEPPPHHRHPIEPPRLPTLAADVPPPESLAGQVVWVIDAHSLIHQVFHAMPAMSGPRGEPIGAVFGFTRDVLYILQDKQPDYLFCAFDMPGKTFRHEIYEDYKKQRPPMDIDLLPQMPYVYRVIEALGIPALGCEGYEADDILATVARITEQIGGKCMLVTSDKDCRQLISDRVKIYNIRKDTVFDRKALEEEWGIAPRQVVDFQALVGDSADGVPGVPSIGPKTARQLLERFNSLDNLLERLAEVEPQRIQELLRKHQQQALLSRELVRLKDDVPVAIDWRAGKAGQIDVGKALDVFRELGFRKFAQQVQSLKRDIRAAPVSTRPAIIRHLVDTPEALAAFLEQMGQQKCISVDTETTHLWPRWAELVGISFAWDDHQSWYLPLRAPAGERCLPLATVLQGLKPILENPNIEKIGQNLKYDMIVLRSAGDVRLCGIAFDTMVASYLLEAGQRTHSLDELAKRYLDRPTIRIEELIGSGKKQKKMDEVPVERVAEYAGDHALLPLQLRPILSKRIEQQKLHDLLVELELPLVEVLAEMEYTGVRIDVDFLARLSRRYAEKMEALEAEIHQLAGRQFNIASPKQLQQVLFDQLKLHVVKRTARTGPSTDAEVLEALAPKHPLPAKILQYRQYAKLKGTYVDALPQMVHPQTGRVHASFHQAVTATGRLSSSDPNLQNIPVRTEEGREIRAAFVPGEEGWVLLSADYSQIELRVLAHLSGDEGLCQAFMRDEDIHARVAAQVNGVPLEQVTPQMRRVAKTINFGIIYGQTPAGLAKVLGIEKQEAAKFIDSYFAGYPSIERFLIDVLNDCRKKGYVSTLLGRRRAIRGIRPEPTRQRNLPERTAVNTVVQGSAADLIKKAMVAIHHRLQQQRLHARLLLQIHDELIFEVSSQHLADLARLVRDEMSGVYPLRVPLKVDLSAGPNWAQTQEIAL